MSDPATSGASTEPTDPCLDFAVVSEALVSGRVPVAPTFSVDLYRDIHKGLRAELFGLTLAAGDTDPLDDAARADLAAHMDRVAGVLEAHAHHEDAFLDAPLRAVDPALADRIDAEHHEVKEAFAAADALARAVAGATGDDRRGGLQLLHLQLAAFTSSYLRHLLVEERVAMVRLADALGPEGLAEIDQAMAAAIPPDQMAASLAFMLPAMNADDRAELLGGLRDHAPAEVYGPVLTLARSVLDPAALRATEDRLRR